MEDNEFLREVYQTAREQFQLRSTDAVKREKRKLYREARKYEESTGCGNEVIRRRINAAKNTLRERGVDIPRYR